MNRKFLIIAVGIVIAAGIFLTQRSRLSGVFSSSGGTIVMTDDGYTPKNLTVKNGQKVIFRNESSKDKWPASNLHPTHGIYPEFDPKEPVKPGTEWSFVFKKSGKWKYHDHITPNMTGAINVID